MTTERKERSWPCRRVVGAAVTMCQVRVNWLNRRKKLRREEQLFADEVVPEWQPSATCNLPGNPCRQEIYHARDYNFCRASAFRRPFAAAIRLPGPTHRR